MNIDYQYMHTNNVHNHYKIYVIPINKIALTSTFKTRNIDKCKVGEVKQAFCTLP